MLARLAALVFLPLLLAACAPRLQEIGPPVDQPQLIENGPPKNALVTRALHMADCAVPRSRQKVGPGGAKRQLSENAPPKNALVTGALHMADGADLPLRVWYPW